MKNGLICFKYSVNRLNFINFTPKDNAYAVCHIFFSYSSCAFGM